MKTYTERDARDWERALKEKDAEIARLQEQLSGADAMIDTLREAERVAGQDVARLRAALKPFANLSSIYVRRRHESESNSMSIAVTVIPPPGLPDPKERATAFARCPGNIMTAPEVLGYPYHLDESPDAILYLKAIISELDKGDAGKFSDAWCVEMDMRWSQGRDMNRAWCEVAALTPRTGAYASECAYWGYTLRSKLRSDALRFFLYYAAGYEVRWSP